MVKPRVVVASLSVLLIAACGGGGDGGDDPTGDTESTSDGDSVFEPLSLTTVHEWTYADVRLPAEWPVIGELPGGFQIASEPDLVLLGGLTAEQVLVKIGYRLNDPSLDAPLVDAQAEFMDRWDLELVESIDTTMLGHPTQVVTASGDEYDSYVARVVTGPAAAFVLEAYVAPSQLDRYSPTFEEMIDTAVLKGLLAGE